MPRPPKPLPHGPVGQLFRGFGYPLEALGFINSNKLWGLTTFAIIVNVVLFVGLLAVGFYWAGPLFGRIDFWLQTLFEWEWWQAVAAFLSWLFWIVWILAAVVAGSFILLLLGQAVASPFLDMLSEKVEVIVLGAEPAPFGVGRTLKAIAIAISDLIWSIGYMCAFAVPVWIVGVITGVGTAVAAVLSFAFNALILGQEFFGLSLARQLVPFRKRWSVMWRNKWLALGFGSAVTLLLIVPLINLVLLPLAAVGGTLMYCDLKASGRADP